MVGITPEIPTLDSPIRQQIMKMTLEQRGEISYQQASKALGEIGKRLDYHFTVLVTDGLLKRVLRGSYRIAPERVQELREYFGIITPIALIGGLGQDLSLLTDLSQALRKVSIVPKHRLIITSPEITQQLRENTLLDQKHLEIMSFDYQVILRGDPIKIKKQVQNWFLLNYLEYNIVCDLTGGTKPVTIALLDLGKQYHWRIVYFSSKQLVWL